jgi:hypothetical protein
MTVRDWRAAESIVTLPMVPMQFANLLPHQEGLYIAVIGHCYVGYVGMSWTSILWRWYQHRAMRGTAGKAAALIELAHRFRLDGIQTPVLIHYLVDAWEHKKDLLADERSIRDIWNPPLNAPRYGKDGSPWLIREHWVAPPEEGVYRPNIGWDYVTAEHGPTYWTPPETALTSTVGMSLMPPGTTASSV